MKLENIEFSTGIALLEAREAASRKTGLISVNKQIKQMSMFIKRHFRDVQHRSSTKIANSLVLRSALNIVSVGEVVREGDREFQKKGPKKRNADLAKECLTRVKKKLEQEDDRQPGLLGSQCKRTRTGHKQLDEQQG
ncbi:hypothetical protein HELRODRAFT_182257 [Helobdella robusta]|uniref:Uncharacterized protein n=1 Tax=Helobdella robusta TaxID=6412 RepID=T1FI02_HELRO|nr:hypothetical protein HELRODRAFT_182257 [Helobdella robusta]ESN91101.1 hypothetical protein HELRODRAFT_182257 [Helobdella robusta]